ncbi:cob(I)alamin adenolsyltransferase [Parasalinivibrio latis]|uniref:alpha/beta fold hydrolase n=1 Tax=Parasalinivibrio latis TaxID=2952610 RepID=UPI0030E0EE33
MKVVVLHGLYMHGIVMLPLCNRIEEAGHEVLNLSYHTTKPDIPELFSKIDTFIGDAPCCLIGHSMGGVISRAYLDAGSPQSDNVRAVITLGTPHQGSSLAGFIRSLDLDEFMFRDSKRFLLPDDVHEWRYKAKLHSIAGDLPIGPATLFLPRADSDGTVLLEETKIEGMESHEVYPFAHTALIYSRRVTERILALLDHYSA